MARFQQFEVWRMTDGKWQLIASFDDFDIAHAVATNHRDHIRLLRVTYDGDTAVEQEVIAEIGAIRNGP